mmetsp:Transcript_155515/g.498877  ORF Transcript_155515/g.498877 Transcript_155515/m.498877 type:complete len:108 (+) Transcript_155515:103-426(+)
MSFPMSTSAESSVPKEAASNIGQWEASQNTRGSRALAEVHIMESPRSAEGVDSLQLCSAAGSPPGSPLWGPESLTLPLCRDVQRDGGCLNVAALRLRLMFCLCNDGF